MLRSGQAPGPSAPALRDRRGEGKKTEDEMSNRIPLLFTVLVLCSCVSESKQDLKTKNEFETSLRDSFYINNSFDSLKVLIIIRNDSIRNFIIEDDIFDVYPYWPEDSANYIVTTSSGNTIKIINGAVEERIREFELRNTPLNSIFISRAELDFIINFKHNQPNTDCFDLKKYTFKREFNPDEFIVIKDDFDNDDTIEYCITAISWIEGEKSAFTTFVENTNSSLRIVYGFICTTEHFESDIPVYFNECGLFKLRYDIWGSCHEIDEFEIVKYYDNELIHGPRIASYESSCVDEIHPKDVTYVYYKEIRQKFIPLSKNHFRIDTKFTLWAGKENGEEGKDIFKRDFSIIYIFSSSRKQFEMPHLSERERTIFEEDYFAEGGKFLEASLPEIRKMKDSGTPEQKEYLKDFTYFDE